MVRTGLWLPGQFGLVHCLATEMFQEVGIDLWGDSLVRIPWSDAGLDPAGRDGGEGRGGTRGGGWCHITL